MRHLPGWRGVRRGQWWVGDWLNYGERAYGEKYAQAMDVTGLEYDTLSSYRWVAAEIEPCLRKQKLSWSHHKEVAALEPAEQAEWLDRAETDERVGATRPHPLDGGAVLLPSLSHGTPGSAVGIPPRANRILSGMGMTVPNGAPGA